MPAPSKGKGPGQVFTKPHSLIRAAPGQQINVQQYSTLRYTLALSALASIPLEYPKLDVRWSGIIIIDSHCYRTSTSSKLCDQKKQWHGIDTPLLAWRKRSCLPIPRPTSRRNRYPYYSGQSHNVNGNQQCGISPQDGLSFMINEITGLGKILWIAIPTNLCYVLSGTEVSKRSSFLRYKFCVSERFKLRSRYSRTRAHKRNNTQYNPRPQTSQAQQLI